jgi:hypothetical protein
MPTKAKKPKRATGHGSRATKKPSERDLREAGFECPNLAAAAERLGVADLVAMLKRSKRLSAAWDRGRVLRRVKDVASMGIVPEEADRHLEWPRGELVERIKTDRALAEVWDLANFEARTRARRGLMALAETGDRKAMQLYERLLDVDAKAESSIDCERLRPVALAKMTGIKREQWDRWAKESGCPRNIDGSYSLARVIDWLRKWERDKATGGKEAVGLNPMQTEKARMYKLQADEAEGRLIDRPTIVRVFCEQAARMVQLLGEARADQWSHEHEGKTAAQLKDSYVAAFRHLREIYEKFPPEVPMPAAAKAKIEEGIQILLATETTESTEKGTADERR